MYRKFIKPKPVPKNCSFCKEDKEPDYKEISKLRTFMTERGRILSRARTGICAKHQRRIATQIKRARHLAYLPFVGGL
ncbi:MAG: 30S ribosomal protein S18 [Patescibacteria group bacterium]|nr:30S ribosomal protein S18 [Patescibacteria group bacterium]MCL5432157.1 30S ribosomal protein S18 [Patescibacteria group bacterium]